MSDNLSQDMNLDRAQEQELKKIVAKDSKVGRTLSGFWGMLVSCLGLVMVVFYFYSAGITPLDTQYQRGIYVLLTYLMVFLSYPFWSRSNMKRPTVLDLVFAGLAIFSVGYFMFEFADYNYRSGSATNMDIIVSYIGIAVSLEVARRVLGWSMFSVGVLFVLYGMFGRYMPDVFAHRGFSLDRIMVYCFMEQEGVFGIMASVLVTYVILFIFFGAFLQKSGVGKFFIDWPMALTGRSYGGPAKVAVIASAFFGSVSGSAIANTVSTGAFTIPLMKRTGFKPHVAGAIEPAASIGGMFMPPIMGAGGFLMAEFTGLPYRDIMIMAIFPACLYFLSVLTMVHFEARKHNIRGLVEEGAPSAWQVFKKGWYKMLPLAIIVLLMLTGFSPGMSAFWATISCVAVSWIDKEHRMGFPEIWEAIVGGAKATLIIGATVGVIGIVVATINLTGIGSKMTYILTSLSQGILPLAIVLVAIASLILGMGVPVTAAYLITAVLVVPFLSQMLMQAVPAHTEMSALIASHMIVYWFSQDSNITPPVCVAAYAGAAIAGSDPWKTGWTSFKFAKLLYVVPFLFAYEPGMLLFGSFHDIVLVFITAVIGTIAFSSLTMGFMIRRTTLFEWCIFAVGTFFCYHPDILTDLMGLSLVGIVFWMQWLKNKKDAARLAAA